MAIQAFRTFAHDLRKPAGYYCPVIIETRGALNLALGSLQLIAGECFRCCGSTPRHAQLADRHIQIGIEALQQGCADFLPGGAVVSFVYFAYFKDNS